jgi:hypothetical protein
VKPPRKIGAPPKRAPRPGERFQIGVRVTPEMKQRLDAAAQRSGRSLSQEAEFRLEHSFDRQELMPEVLATGYRSKQFAGLLMLVGEAMMNAGYHARSVGRINREIVSESADAWLSDPYSFDQAVRAANHILHAFRPPGDPTSLAGKDMSLVERALPQGEDESYARIDDAYREAQQTLEGLLRLLQSRKDTNRLRLFLLGGDIAHDLIEFASRDLRGSMITTNYDDTLRQIHTLLGPAIERMRQPGADAERSEREARMAWLLAAIRELGEQHLAPSAETPGTDAHPSKAAAKKGRKP